MSNFIERQRIFVLHSRRPLVRRRWSKKDNIYLFLLVESYTNGNKEVCWRSVAKFFPGRTANCCRNHYYSLLGDERRSKSWAEDDDERLMQLVEKHGKKFKIISREINASMRVCKEKYELLRKKSYLTDLGISLSFQLLNFFVPDKKDDKSLGEN